MGWTDKSTPKAKLTLINPSIATDEIEELPSSIFTEELNLKNSTYLKMLYDSNIHICFICSYHD